MDLPPPASCEEITLVQGVIGAIRNIRGEMTIPMDAKVDVLLQHPSAETRAVLESATAQVQTLANVKALDIRTVHAPAPFASTHVSGDMAIQVLASC